MRKLILVKGPQGSGKSTFIEQVGWGPYASSMDQLRQLRRAPELDMSGKLSLSQEENHSVVEEWFSVIEKKMERGEFVVLDATFADGRPDRILALADKYLYQCACVDFSTVPTDRVLAQNDGRPEYKRVSHHIIRKTMGRLHSQKKWEGNIEVFPWSETGDHLKVLEWCKEPVVNLEHYKKIIHIGDLQGCLSVLTGKGGVLENGFEDDCLYVFVGDLLDRGIENGVLMRWFVDHALSRSNVVLIWGNHEDHLRRMAMGQDPVSDEFANKTLPQLIKEGITPQDALAVCKKAVDALFYEFHGHQVMITHAGLPTVPSDPHLISLRQYSKGTGRWSDPIDEQFERNAPLGWVQVHGHRNHGWQEIQARPRSFNLEDQVEFGGRLRWCVLSKEGWSVGSNRNEVYELEGSSKIEKRRVAWKNEGMLLSDQTAQNLRTHDGVRERVMDDQPHIVSFNFTKDVFFTASWDDVVVKARGFFVNKNSNEIVARGYDKFFNIGERSDTKIDVLCKSLKFPVMGYLKENGYLGNIGYDAISGELFVATKSSSGGDFSQWFREILNTQLTRGQQEGLARWLRDNEASMTFEVIDPVRDPHMVSYDKPKLILLDVFHRSEHTERLPYDELRVVANRFGLECKQRSILFGNPEAFAGWYEKVHQDLNWRYKGQDVEGFVLEDASGEMVKIKMASYSFWKKMRSQKDRMLREWEKIVEAGARKNERLDREPNNRAPRFDLGVAQKEFSRQWSEKGQSIHPLAGAFLSWCAHQDSKMWSKSIIDLRQEFLSTSPDASLWSTPFSPVAQPTPSRPAMKP